MRVWLTQLSGTQLCRFSPSARSSPSRPPGGRICCRGRRLFRLRGRWPYYAPPVRLITSLFGASHMHLVEILLKNSEQDRKVLDHNASIGDRMEEPRDIDFAFHSRDEGQAKTVGSFFIDNHYGMPKLELVDDPKFGRFYRLTVVIKAPATEHIVCSISGLMACIGAIFGIEYVGWGSFVQNGDARGTR